MLCGMCALCRKEDSFAGRISTLTLFIIGESKKYEKDGRQFGLFYISGVVWVLVSSLVNILIVYFSWPFCFDQSFEQTIAQN